MGGDGRRRRHGRRRRRLTDRKAEHGLGLGFLDTSEVEAAGVIGGGAGMGGGGRQRRHGRRHQLLTDGKAEHGATIRSKRKWGLHHYSTGSEGVSEKSDAMVRSRSKR
jgi:hypothetical protein